MKMWTVKARRTSEVQVQTGEYVPAGPVVLASQKPARTSQKVRCTSIPPKAWADRISGRIYDFHSGQCFGPASDEMRAELAPGVKHTRYVSGMKQEFVIQP